MGSNTSGARYRGRPLPRLPRLLLLPLLVALAGCEASATSEGDADDGPPRVAAPRFSHDRGFYDSPFEVAIESDTAGALIGWTLDGSDPRSSSTARSAPSPARVSIDPDATQGRDRTPGVVLRAWARLEDGELEPTEVDTQTYLFLDRVVRQPREIGPGWPLYDYRGNGGPSEHDYEMDPAIVDDPAYADDLRSGLREIPSLSLVMDRAQFWEAYRGTDVERPVSVELIHEPPPGGAVGAAAGPARSRETITLRPDELDAAPISEQHDGALEAHSHHRTKGSLRLTFRPRTDGDWVTRLLRTSPLASAAAPDEVARLVLRAGNNRSWARSWNPDRTAYTVDEWYRATQAALSGYAAHGAFVHLYVNGLYWGLYNPVERPDRHWAAGAFGGDDDQWAAVSHGGWMAGDRAGWDALMALVDAPLEDAAAYASFDEALDVAGFADYVLLAFYIGIRDWPSNNWWALGRTQPAGPFRFAAWDGEWSFGNGFESPERPRVHPDFEGEDGLGDARRPPIERLFNAAKAHPEFRMLLADRAERAVAPGGALADDQARARWAALNAHLRNAVVAESARWGDAIVGGPTRTRDEDWQREVDFIDRYMDGAAEELVRDLVRHGYFPSPDGETPFHGPRLAGAPRDPGPSVAVPVSAGATLQLQAPDDGVPARLLYAFDADPRLPGGAVSPSAVELGRDPQPPIERSTLLRARRLASEQPAPLSSPELWSPVLERLLVVRQDRSALRISEIHYHPAGHADLEFVELHNGGATPIDLGGLRFVDGIRHDFALGTRMEPGEHLVVARDPQRLADAAGLRGALGYEGRLSNGGERLSLVDALGEPVLSLSYDDDAPWPELADGRGASLVPLAPSGRAGSDPARWRSSEAPGGSPGAPDPASRSMPSFLPESRVP